jgi:hypothetical protein
MNPSVGAQPTVLMVDPNMVENKQALLDIQDWEDNLKVTADEYHWFRLFAVSGNHRREARQRFLREEPEQYKARDNFHTTPFEMVVGLSKSLAVYFGKQVNKIGGITAPESMMTKLQVNSRTPYFPVLLLLVEHYMKILANLFICVRTCVRVMSTSSATCRSKTSNCRASSAKRSRMLTAQQPKWIATTPFRIMSEPNAKHTS